MNKNDRPLRSLFQILQIPFEIQSNSRLVVIPIRNGFNPDVGYDGIMVGPSRVGDVDFFCGSGEFVEFGKEESGEMVRSGSREGLDAVSCNGVAQKQPSSVPPAPNFLSFSFSGTHLTTRPSSTALHSLPKIKPLAAAVNPGSPVIGRYSWSMSVFSSRALEACGGWVQVQGRRGWKWSQINKKESRKIIR